MIFGVWNREQMWHQKLINLSTAPVICSHFTLGNPQKVIFNNTINTYFCLFALSQNKMNCKLAHHTWKTSSHYLVKCRTCSSDWRYIVFLQNFGGFEKSRLWWVVWQLECQASNITASVQNDHLLHGHVLSVFFLISLLINRIVHHALQKFSPCLNKPLPQLVRIADWYSIHTLLCHAQM